MNRKVVVNPEVLWEHLQVNHLTQREFANQIGHSSGFVSQLLSGQRSYSTKTTRRMQEALDVDYHVLFRFEEKDG